MPETLRFTKRGRILKRTDDRHFTSPGGGNWGAYETRLPHYMEDLGKLERYPGEVVDMLTASDKPVVIDVLSSTGMLQDLCIRVLGRKAGTYIAVGNYDNRMRFREDSDTANGIKMVEGDIREATTWQKLRKELDGDEADVIFSRALAGLYYVPTKSLFGYRSISEGYDLLKDYGSMFLQIPPVTALREFSVPIERWVEELGAQGIPHKYIPEYTSITDMGRTYGLLRIDRLPGVPELPTVEVKGLKTLQNI